MRIVIVKYFFLLFFLAITSRLFYWQVVKADELSAKAENQHFKRVQIGARRGNIYYSNGSMLASTNPVFSLYGLPKVIPDAEKVKVSQDLAKIIANEKYKNIVEEEEYKKALSSIKEDFSSKLTQDLYWVLLRKNIDMETKEKIEGLKSPGLGFESSSGRFYPEGSSSAHLLGFVGFNARGESTGYFGIEGFYDGDLKGIPGIVRHEKDAMGLPILIGKFLTTESKNGKDLGLNIDQSVQFIVERALKKGVEKYGAKAGSVVVMDPKTGDILALGAFPNYDPLKYYDFPKDYYKNPIVAEQYEPGSTFKVLVMAAAINEDLVKPDTKCDICDKAISLGGFTIRTWNNKYYPNATMKEVIVHSDNTGMVFVAKKLGLDKMYKYIQDFGFGQPTQIDLQDETSPDIRSKDTWREIDLATSSFGQGIAVTPIQMVRAVAAIANKGYLMEPHVVKEIQDGEEKFVVKPKIVRQVISENAAKIMTEIMVAAVEEGESKWVKPKGFKVAGKTGTAQIPVAGHYDPNKTIASFVGFAPADDPKFVMLVRFDQPTSSIYGSETAAPTFFEIAKELFTYFKIAPSE
ncbi:penicillin-binding protein 2 [Candidatus Daviesbacteria bacterium]|nr:penicillin-binding protein 2 [Candidatus Daviesbacteria bacterium]